MKRAGCSRACTRVLVDTPLARVSPDIMGYAGGYYQWDNNWKLTGRFGVQHFGGAQLLNLTPFPYQLTLRTPLYAIKN